jgi:hypothetical protein
MLDVDNGGSKPKNIAEGERGKAQQTIQRLTKDARTIQTICKTSDDCNLTVDAFLLPSLL